MHSFKNITVRINSFLLARRDEKHANFLRQGNCPTNARQNSEMFRQYPQQSLQEVFRPSCSAHDIMGILCLHIICTLLMAEAVPKFDSFDGSWRIMYRFYCASVPLRICLSRWITQMWHLQRPWSRKIGVGYGLDDPLAYGFPPPAPWASSLPFPMFF